MSDFLGTLSTSSLRCSHSATLSLVATSSSSSLVYVGGRFNQCCLTPFISLATFNPEITVGANSWSSFNVLIIISVFLPRAPSLPIMLLLMKQPWLQLSNITNVETSLLVYPWVILIGTTHILMIFDSMFADFTSISAKLFLKNHYHHLCYCQLLHQLSISYIPMHSSWMLHCTNFADAPFLASLGNMLCWYWEVATIA